MGSGMKNLFLTLAILIVVSAVVLAGCTQNGTPPLAQNEAPPQFNRITMEKFDSFGDSSELTIKETSLYSDGVITVRELKAYDENGESYPPKANPVLEMSAGRVSEEELIEIAKLLKNFGSAPERIETGVMDGHFTFVEVETAEGALRKGGLIAEQYGPKGFTGICDVLKTLSENTDLFACCPLFELVDSSLGNKIEETPPAAVVFRRGTMASGESVVSEDSAVITAVSESLQAMWVGQEQGEEDSEDYTTYTLKLADGTQVSLEFQSGMLIYGTKLYQTWGYDKLRATFGG